jgi:hypothetical protein
VKSAERTVAAKNELNLFIIEELESTLCAILNRDSVMNRTINHLVWQVKTYFFSRTANLLPINGLSQYVQLRNMKKHKEIRLIWKDFL